MESVNEDLHKCNFNLTICENKNEIRQFAAVEAECCNMNGDIGYRYARKQDTVAKYGNRMRMRFQMANAKCQTTPE